MPTPMTEADARRALRDGLPHELTQATVRALLGREWRSERSRGWRVMENVDGWGYAIAAPAATPGWLYITAHRGKQRMASWVQPPDERRHHPPHGVRPLAPAGDPA